MRILVAVLLSGWAVMVLGQQGEVATALPVAMPSSKVASSAVPSMNAPRLQAAEAPHRIDDPLLQSRGSWGQAYPDQWGLLTIGAVSEAGSRPPYLPELLEPVVVALIDTGLDYRHPDLPLQALWRNPDEQPNGRDDDGNGLIDDLIGWNFVERNNQPWDDHGHGTHVAGIIAAGQDNGRGISGLAPNARLMVLKALDVSGHGSGSHIAQAIRYATQKGARLIQLSLGGDAPGAAELDALSEALNNEVTVVVAAGNRASDDNTSGYERLDGVILVGAIDPQEARAKFSNWGAGLDLMAPGVDILSLRARGSDFLRLSGDDDYTPGAAFVGRDYYRATGNSFAAPYVTGLAALILGRAPWLEPQQLERILTQSARDAGPAGRDQAYGYGIIDVARAMSRDPEQYVEARLVSAEIDAQRQLVVKGTTDADRFYQARLEYGRGDSPAQWQALLPRPITAPVVDQPLVRLDLSLLPRGQLLTVRLTTEHLNGETRESRLQLQLPSGGDL